MACSGMLWSVAFVGCNETSLCIANGPSFTIWSVTNKLIEHEFQFKNKKLIDDKYWSRGLTWSIRFLDDHNELDPLDSTGSETFN